MVLAVILVAKLFDFAETFADVEVPKMRPRFIILKLFIVIIEVYPLIIIQVIHSTTLLIRLKHFIGFNYI